MDRISEKHRSWNMSRIRSDNTRPEKIVRKFLLKKKIRYRLNVKELPGKPDIVIDKSKKTIFVNGCFWHQHKGCKRQTMPKENRDYWKLKLERNVAKQKEDIKKLKKGGWKVTVIWECEAKNQKGLNKKLQKSIV